MLSDKEKKILKSYEKQLTMPKWKYVLLYGVIAWGIPVGIMVSLASMLINKKSFDSIVQNELLINLIGFPIGGIVFGLFMRRLLPRQIKKLKEKEGATGDQIVSQK